MGTDQQAFTDRLRTLFNIDGWALPELMATQRVTFMQRKIERPPLVPGAQRFDIVKNFLRQIAASSEDIPMDRDPRWFETGMRIPNREEWPRLKSALAISDEFDQCFEEAEREVTGVVTEWTNRSNYALCPDAMRLPGQILVPNRRAIIVTGNA
jgi:hypothetical protein